MNDQPETTSLTRTSRPRLLLALWVGNFLTQTLSTFLFAYGWSTAYTFFYCISYMVCWWLAMLHRHTRLSIAIPLVGFYAPTILVFLLSYIFRDLLQWNFWTANGIGVVLFQNTMTITVQTSAIYVIARLLEMCLVRVEDFDSQTINAPKPLSIYSILLITSLIAIAFSIRQFVPAGSWMTGGQSGGTTMWLLLIIIATGAYACFLSFGFVLRRKWLIAVIFLGSLVFSSSLSVAWLVWWKSTAPSSAATFPSLTSQIGNSAVQLLGMLTAIVVTQFCGFRIVRYSELSR